MPSWLLVQRWCRIAREQEDNHRQPDRHGLGTLSTKLNAPSNFMHTLGNDCFSLGLVQIPRPFRPSLSLSLFSLRFATLFARLVSRDVLCTWTRLFENYWNGRRKCEYYIVQTRVSIVRSLAEWDMRVCIFPPRWEIVRVSLLFRFIKGIVMRYQKENYFSSITNIKSISIY